MIKRASPDHPVHDVITQRWSPYAFGNAPVSDADLSALFEAARWAPSSYNEQPWSYIIATKADPAEFERLLSCLVEANQVWAKHAPVLALGVTHLKFSHNGKPNRAAVHDLGLAAGNLLAEATARGIYVHQMIGILPDRARELYAVPDDCEVLTAMAIGYPGTGDGLPEEVRVRDDTPRTRKTLSDFVFGGEWGKTAKLAD